jgi:hypothetical protein
MSKHAYSDSHAATGLKIFWLTTLMITGFLSALAGWSADRLGGSDLVNNLGMMNSAGNCVCDNGQAEPLGTYNSAGNCVCASRRTDASDVMTRQMLDGTQATPLHPGNELASETFGSAPGGSSAALGPAAVSGTGLPLGERQQAGTLPARLPRPMPPAEGLDLGQKYER